MKRVPVQVIRSQTTELLLPPIYFVEAAHEGSRYH
jgi:hypothetical protein